MMFNITARLGLSALVVAVASQAHAQGAVASVRAPEVGSLAPDFALPGATRFGTLAAPVHLSDFRGKTVVLAFFYRARTKG